MGTTPSGKKYADGTVYKQNTIGDYGCLFTSTVNIADDMRNRYIKSHGASTIETPKSKVSEFNTNDSFFTFSADYESGEFFENDANMTVENIRSLVSAVAKVPSNKILIETVSGRIKIDKALHDLKNNETKNAYVIGKYKGHYFVVSAFDYAVSYTIEDVYKRKKKTAEKYEKDVRYNGLEQIYIISVQN